VVSGAGRTNAIVNGEGNLVIGHDENTGNERGRTAAQTGSHNLILGEEQEFTSYGGIVAGYLDNIRAPFASVLGVGENTASGIESAVLGGVANVAGWYEATVTGGSRNTATATESVASGGLVNMARATNSAISGGRFNVTEGDAGWVGGGYKNVVKGMHASVFGGRELIAKRRIRSHPVELPLAGSMRRECGDRCCTFTPWGARVGIGRQ
jgi:trimeric autotransporter adhesin